MYNYLENKNINLVQAIWNIPIIILVKNQLMFIREDVTTEFNKRFNGHNIRLNDLFYCFIKL